MKKIPVKLLLCCLSLFFFCESFAQRHQKKVLYKILSTEKDDTNKVNTLYQLAQTLTITSEFAKADSVANIEMQLATKLHYSKGIADAYANLGNNRFYVADLPKGIDYYLKERKLSDSIGYTKGIANSYNGIAEIHEEQNSYQEALQECFKALELFKKVPDSDGIANSENDIGEIYIVDKQDSLARIHLIASLNIFQKLHDTARMEYPLMDLGRTYNSEGKHTEAIDYFITASKYEQISGDGDGLSACLMDLAGIYLEMNKSQEAIQYATKSLETARKIYSISDIETAERMLSKVYLQTGNPTKALEYYKAYASLHDSAYGPESMKKALDIEKNYEFKIKQDLEKAQLDKKEAEEKADVKRKNILLSAVGVILLLVIFFTIILLNRFRITQHQKKIIAEKNKEVLDSINYAQRIQQSMLPDINVISRELPDSFILFKPKDIVSGDFYFFSKTNSKIYIAAADCTGHGVPGGFMSMLCSEKLNDAIASNPDVGEALHRVNKGVKATLGQSKNEDSAKDGMDIALCTIEDKQVSFAGANRPLWIIRKGENEIEEIKPTKVSIGGFTEDVQTFESHKVQLNEGDTFYIFSDGYADQFGGEKGKKLTIKKFKEKLLSICTLPMRKQLQELDSYIESWKERNEQVDDILVIGIRV
jgi:serine phosphatase RsbU (regulator of sigma subunit)